MVGSYVTVSELAARRGVPLAVFVSAGIDGGLPMRNVISERSIPMFGN